MLAQAIEFAGAQVVFCYFQIAQAQHQHILSAALRFHLKSQANFENLHFGGNTRIHSQKTGSNQSA
jgi:hypothetical protein